MPININNIKDLDGFREIGNNLIELLRIIKWSRYETGKQQEGYHHINKKIFISICDREKFEKELAFELLKELGDSKYSDNIIISESTLRIYNNYSDSNYSYIPHVEKLLKFLFGDSFGEENIKKLINDNIKQRFNILYEDQVLVQIKALSIIFNNLSTSSFNYYNLINVLKSEEKLKENIVNCFLELLEVQGTVKPNDWNLCDVRIYGKADYSFLINQLFSFKTGISGLDYLFQGGIMIPPNLGINIVINGASGTGKTTLAMSIGAAWSNNGNLTLYYSFEQQINSLLKIIPTLNLNKYDTFRVENLNNFILPDFLNETTSKQGNLICSELTKKSKTILLDEIKSVVKALKEYNNFKVLIIFDAINSILEFDKSSNEWRNFIADLSFELKTIGASVLFIVEETQKKIYLEPFISDVSIQLSYTTNNEYKMRTLEIIKSRNQPIHRGVHQFSINKEKGIDVYPSPISVLSKSYRRTLRVLPKNSPSIYIDTSNIKNFSNYLGDQWWKYYSSTAVIGESGTHKAYFAQELFKYKPSKSNLHDTKHSSTLIINFGTEFYTPSEVNNKKKSSFGFINEIFSRDKNHSVIELTFRVGYISAGQVLVEVEHLINEGKHNGYVIHEVIVRDLNNISHQYPILNKEEQFLPALTDYLLSEPITLIYVCSTNGDIIETSIQKQTTSIVENILHFQHVYFGDKDFVGISIKKSTNSNHKKGIYHLDLNGTELSVENSLNLLKNIRIGKPERIDINLMLYHETDIQEEYNQTLIDTFSPSFFNITSQNPKIHSIGYNKLPSEILPRNTDLNLIQFDNYRILQLLNQNQFVRLDEYTAIDKTYLDQFHNTALDIVKNNGGVYALPFYMNPSFLCYRREAIDYDPLTDTWDSIIEKSIYAKANKEEFRSLDVFNCPTVSSETYNCLFLEILYSLGENEIRETLLSSKHCNKNNCVKSIFTDKNSLKAANLFYKLLSQDTNNLAKSETDFKSEISSGSIVWRLWYSSYRQLIKTLKKEGLGKQIQIAPLPANCTSQGNWYLAIKKNSLGVDTGINLIKHLCNKENAIERYITGVGLPAYKDFERKDFYDLGIEGIISRYNSSTIINSVIDKQIMRTNWKCYPNFHLILNKLLINILEIQFEEIGEDERVVLIKKYFELANKEFLWLIDKGECLY